MGLFTDRPPAVADDFIEETRNVQLPGTKGRDGLPLVVKIRRLPAALLYGMNGDAAQSFVGRMEEYRTWAKEAVIEPRFAFNDQEPGPAWDRVPMAGQVAIANAIAMFSTEGMDEVTAASDAFRGRDAGGPAAGTPGGGPDDAGQDASRVEAASANGAHAGPLPGAGIRPHRSGRRPKAARV